METAVHRCLPLLAARPLCSAARAPRLVAPNKATSPLKTRVGGFRGCPSGRSSRNAPPSRETATGCRRYGYKTVLGRSRWPNRDPIGEKGGVNLYGFVRNAPCGFYDPLGKEVPVWLRWGGGAGAALVALYYGGNYACDRWACPRYVQAAFAAAEREADQITAGDNQHRVDQTGSADALTHCIANCELAKNPFLCKSAQQALDAAMDREDRAIPAGRMDSLNNIVGSQLGRAGAPNCANTCIRALNSGSLWGINAAGEVFQIPAREYYEPRQ